ncbi:MAG: hypothetical protein JSR81_07940 [Proteobacteria bacterium]|nr:hypothetical protein [Pseudomonadota bacterium]
MPQPPYEIDVGGADTLPRWFAAGRDASLAIVERFRVEQPTQTIFHYTSSAALISIVRNNELWLSDATFLNDRVEIAHGREIARARIEAATSWDGHPEVRAMMKAALDIFETKPDPVVYVACFSWEGDDLAQWRGYGRGDAPIAIELECDPLMFGYTSEGMLHEVRYEQEDQSWTFDQVLRAYWDAYAEDVRNPMPSPRPEPMPVEEENALCAGKLYHDLWRYVVACKNPAFRSEREVRFTYIAHDFASSSRGWYPEHPAPLFRERAGLIIPYLSSSNLNFRNWDRIGELPPLPIRSVRIGPIEDQTLVARGVRRLLKAHGYNSVEVTQSGVPFRHR